MGYVKSLKALVYPLEWMDSLNTLPTKKKEKEERVYCLAENEWNTYLSHGTLLCP
jgi:hypothetical protein